MRLEEAPEQQPVVSSRGSSVPFCHRCVHPLQGGHFLREADLFGQREARSAEELYWWWLVAELMVPECGARMHADFSMLPSPRPRPVLELGALLVLCFLSLGMPCVMVSFPTRRFG